MILTAFRLERDRHTETDTFGYERMLWPQDTQICNYPKLGCPITSSVPIRTKLVKIVECYQRDETVVVERLAWQFGRDLYPYRAKYIRPAIKRFQDDPILFLGNMSVIHRHLGGIGATFLSPIRYCLDEAIMCFRESLSSTYVLDIQHRHRDALAEFSTQETDISLLQNFMLASENGCLYQDENTVVPKLPIAESMSLQFSAQPIPIHILTPAGSGSNPFDTSEVPSIIINHPEVTQYSPKAYHTIARMCDSLSHQYSDAKLEYILSGCRIVDRHVHHLVSRYLDEVEDVLPYCDQIVETAVWISFRPGDGISLTDHTRVIFTLTYGDEVLMEFYAQDLNRCLLAIHLDLAMIALCSSGVIAIGTT